MTISWLQASILGIFASLSSMPGMPGRQLVITLWDDH
ncbi:Protein of unknown function [Leuconostoc citreum]|nr:Protein of unknown function [Leuconostoc citreum]